LLRIGRVTHFVRLFVFTRLQSTNSTKM